MSFNDSQAIASTKSAIMQATLAELAESGISNLTVKSVAIRSEVVPSVVMYHYKTKDGLLLACANCFGSIQQDLTDELASLLQVDEDPALTLDKLVALCQSRGQAARVILDLQVYLQIVRKGQTQEIWKQSLRSLAVLAPLLSSRFGIELLRARALVHQLSVMVVKLSTMASKELTEVYGGSEVEARDRGFSCLKETLLATLR